MLISALGRMKRGLARCRDCRDDAQATGLQLDRIGDLLISQETCPSNCGSDRDPGLPPLSWTPVEKSDYSALRPVATRLV
jgi:hypothetical protein